MNSVAYLRSIGFERITLKTGSYGMEELAMAIKFATDAELDLLTIDGSGGGTGMSPWNMMQSWGVPSVILHAKAYEYASILSAKGKSVVDMSFAGGFALRLFAAGVCALVHAIIPAAFEKTASRMIADMYERTHGRGR